MPYSIARFASPIPHTRIARPQPANQTYMSIPDGWSVDDAMGAIRAAWADINEKHFPGTPHLAWRYEAEIRDLSAKLQDQAIAFNEIRAERDHWRMKAEQAQSLAKKHEALDPQFGAVAERASRQMCERRETELRAELEQKTAEGTEWRRLNASLAAELDKVRALGPAAAVQEDNERLKVMVDDWRQKAAKVLTYERAVQTMLAAVYGGPQAEVGPENVETRAQTTASRITNLKAQLARWQNANPDRLLRGAPPTPIHPRDLPTFAALKIAVGHQSAGAIADYLDAREANAQ